MRGNRPRRGENRAEVRSAGRRQEHLPGQEAAPSLHPFNFPKIMTLAQSDLPGTRRQMTAVSRVIVCVSVNWNLYLRRQIIPVRTLWCPWGWRGLDGAAHRSHKQSQPSTEGP